MNGFFVVMRDCLILEGLFPYGNQKEFKQALKEAENCLRHNRRCYQGSFSMGHAPGKDPAEFFLKPYMKILVTQEDTIRRNGTWIPIPTRT